MKKILLFNGLILSVLTISAQNWVNNDNNTYAFNNTQQSINYTTNLTNVTVQTNVSTSSNPVRTSASNNITRGGGNTIQVQTVQTNNKPKKQKTVEVQTNKNPVVNDVNLNSLDNNVGNPSNPDRGNVGNLWVNDGNSNTQVNTNNSKTVETKTVVLEEFKSPGFKQIGLSGRDYSNGGKMKKGFKNFPKHEKTKVKHKKKPGFKKVKYHTSKCAKW